jgi:hypothetical protein
MRSSPGIFGTSGRPPTSIMRSPVSRFSPTATVRESMNLARPCRTDVFGSERIQRSTESLDLPAIASFRALTHAMSTFTGPSISTPYGPAVRASRAT